MYPFARLVKEFIKFRRAPALALGETHISQHMCLPWDLDFAMELNNGRTLSLYDLGRLLMFKRMGMFSVVYKNGWNVAMAGASVRYRRRITMFNRFEMRSRGIGWDNRFLYVEQSLWKKDGECANHIVYRVALTGKDGIVAPARAIEALGQSPRSPALPDWVEKWSSSEAARPWPPVKE